MFWLNFKPEADGTLQKVAAMYTEKTGVPVTIQTAASGTYNETLTAAMDKEAPPTMFVVGNQAAVDTWGDYCYDLTDTAVYKEMTTDDFNLFGENGEVYCIGYCYEAFGIITNKALLEKATGLPVVLWDERRTTIDAHNILFNNGQNAKKRKKTVDAVAAALMLEGYLTRKRLEAER